MKHNNPNSHLYKKNRMMILNLNYLLKIHLTQQAHLKLLLQRKQRELQRGKGNSSILNNVFIRPVPHKEWQARLMIERLALPKVAGLQAEGHRAVGHLRRLTNQWFILNINHNNFAGSVTLWNFIKIKNQFKMLHRLLRSDQVRNHRIKK